MNELDSSRLSGFLFKYPDTIIVDVRFAYERQDNGYIDGSKHVAWYTPEWDVNPNFINEISRFCDRDSRLVMVCRSGHRSADACQLLIDNGFRQVHNLTGGYLALAELERDSTSARLSRCFTTSGLLVA